MQLNHHNVNRYTDLLVKIGFEGIDPYLIWAQDTGASRLGRITGRHGVAYLQVAIELYAADADDETKRERSANIKTLAQQEGIKFRKIYYQQFARTGINDRFCTAIVPDTKIVEFLQKIAGCCVKYEIGHPIVRANADAAANTTQRLYPDSEDERKRDPPLSGRVMAIIDYGCPFAHAAYRTLAGGSRVKYVWFQDAETVLMSAAAELLPRVKKLNPNTDTNLFPYGLELRGSRINDLLAQHSPGGIVDEDACYQAIGYDLMRESTTHGAHVLSIAVGAPNPLVSSVNAETDDASKAEIIFVQLPRGAVDDASGGSMNCHVIDALRYIQERTTEDADVIVNMSFGTHAGPHDGSSLLESAIDHLISQRKPGKFEVTIPAGNSFNSACHAQFFVKSGEPEILLWEVMADDPTDTFLEIWYSDDSGISVEVMPPGLGSYLAPRVTLNSMASWFGDRSAPACFEPACTIVHVKNATPNNNVALIALAPTRNDDLSQAEARYGIWSVKVSTKSEAQVSVNAWIERDDAIFDVGYASRQSRFFVDPQTDHQDEYPKSAVSKRDTLNSYATAQHVQAVGAAIRPSERAHERDSTGLFGPVVRAAPYSSAGPGRNTTKVAIGWTAYAEESEVLSGVNAGGTRSRYWVRRDGTSVAAPQVARALFNSFAVTPTATLKAVVKSAARLSMTGESGDELTVQGKTLQDNRVSILNVIG